MILSKRDFLSRYVYVRPHMRLVNGKSVLVRGFYRKNTRLPKNEKNNPLETARSHDIASHLDLLPESLTITKDNYFRDHINISNGAIVKRNFSGIDWNEGVTLTKLEFNGCDFQKSSIDDVDMKNVTFFGCGFRDASVVFSPANNVSFLNNDLSGSFIGADDDVDVLDFSNNHAKGVDITFEEGCNNSEIALRDNVFIPAQKGVDYDNDEAYRYTNDVSITLGNDGELFGDITLKKNTIKNGKVYLYGKDILSAGNNFSGSELRIGGNFALDQDTLKGSTIIVETIQPENVGDYWNFANADGTLNHDILSSDARGSHIEGNWVNAAMKKTDFRKAVFKGDFRNADFSGSDLRGADLSNAILTGDELERATMDKTTILPENIKWILKNKDVFNDDPAWSAKNYSMVDDPVFEASAKAYDIEAYKSMGAGTSPVKIVKLKGDGLGVMKFVRNRPGDTERRPNEEQAHFEWRTGVNSAHNGTNEIIAYRLSKLLGLNVVPDTVFTENNEGRAVTIQKFLKGCDVWKDIQGTFGAGEFIGELNERDTGRIQLLDVLMRNRDRHEGNLMVDENNARLWAIDFGHAHPEDREYHEMITTGESFDGVSLDEYGISFYQSYLTSVGDDVEKRIRSLTKKQFDAAFADLLMNPAFFSSDGVSKLANIWESLNEFKEDVE